MWPLRRGQIVSSARASGVFEPKTGLLFGSRRGVVSSTIVFRMKHVAHVLSIMPFRVVKREKAIMKSTLVVCCLVLVTWCSPVMSHSDQECSALPCQASTFQFEEEVLPGVMLTWDGNYSCFLSTIQGLFSIEVSVVNDSSSTILINDFVLVSVGPDGPDGPLEASVDPAGLPLTLGPGESVSFLSIGFFETAETKSGNQAVLGFEVLGEVGQRGFALPVTALFIDPSPEIADLNDDGVVNVFDLLLLLEQWGPCVDPVDCHADFNGDGVVCVLDLLILLNSWG